MGVNQDLKNAILDYDKEKTLSVVKAGLQQDLEPMVMLDAITDALNVVGEGFNSGDLFLPELIYASDCAQAAIKILEEKITSQGKQAEHKGTILLGTVKGDLHDIGKSIVAALLVANGYKVVDLGTDVPTEKLAQGVRDHKPDVIGLSALLTTTAAEMGNVIKKLEEDGLRSSVKVMIGGGATNANYAHHIGADAYGETAVDSVSIVKELMR
jgi:corrinoid protein of di/trimethylamine methyltransferase